MTKSDNFFKIVDPAACSHIADYYKHRFNNKPGPAFARLMWAYEQWSKGLFVQPYTNLFIVNGMVGDLY